MLAATNFYAATNFILKSQLANQVSLTLRPPKPTITSQQINSDKTDLLLWSA